MKTKSVGFLRRSEEGPDGGVTSKSDIRKLTKDEFLEECAKFYDARGTHVDDFETMLVYMPLEENGK